MICPDGADILHCIAVSGLYLIGYGGRSLALPSLAGASVTSHLNPCTFSCSSAAWERPVLGEPGGDSS